jgi:uncharacterized membrane protein YfhO
MGNFHVNYKRFLPFILLLGIGCLFFYQTILSGKIPFPGDLLLNHYAPWRNSAYFGYNPGSIPTKNQYFDVIRELYPWKTLAVSELKQGRWPLWNPYNFSGTPLLANWQSQVFYPPAILYLILPQKIAWTIMAFLQPLFGMIFMYLFATTIGITSTGAILSAVTFNFSAFASVWFEFNTVWHTILWVPLLLYLSEKSILAGKITRKRGLLFILAVFSAMTGGHPQDFLYSLIFAGMYILIRTQKSPLPYNRKRQLLLKFTILACAAFGLGAVQILPALELFRQSARVPHDTVHIAETMLIQPWQLPMIAVQDFFGNPASNSYFVPDTYVNKTLSIGVVGFLLALAVLFARKKSQPEKFFLLTAGIILLFTIRTPVSEFLYRFPIPILSTGTPTRILFILAFSLSILAGFGLDRSKETISCKRFLLAMLGIFLLLAVYTVFFPRLSALPQSPIAAGVMKKALALYAGIATVILIALKAIPKTKIAVSLFVTASLLELFYGFSKFNPFVPAKYVFPDHPLLTYLKEHSGLNRFWGYGTAQIEANFATQYSLFDPNGTDPLNLASYNRLVQFSANGMLDNAFTRQTRSDAYVKSGWGETDLPQNQFRLKILDVLGVKYVIDRDENPKNDRTFPSSRFLPVWQGEGFTVYENLKAAPRFFTTADIRPYQSARELAETMASDSFNPSSTVMIEESDRLFFTDVKEGTSSIKLVSYLPSEIIFEVDLETPQALFISDAYDNGWNAEIDGKSAPLVKANYTLRAVPAPAGKHEIKLAYQPALFGTGLKISIITVIFGTCYFFTIMAKQSIKQKK